MCLSRKQNPSKIESSLEEKNLLLGEQILSFKSRSSLRKGAKMKMASPDSAICLKVLIHMSLLRSFCICFRVHILQLDITKEKEIEEATNLVAATVGDEGKE